jgi:hypothetical protein
LAGLYGSLYFRHLSGSFLSVAADCFRVHYLFIGAPFHCDADLPGAALTHSGG